MAESYHTHDRNPSPNCTKYQGVVHDKAIGSVKAAKLTQDLAGNGSMTKAQGR
jgi:hypothetical protein